MANIPARTFPIAMFLGGITLIVTAITLYETSSHPNDFLTFVVSVIGLCLALVSIAVYEEERSRYYADRHEDRHAIHL
jgi:EamA domain-containing membrane protein RarD